MNVIKYFILEKGQQLLSGKITKLTSKGVYLNGSAFITKQVKYTTNSLDTIINSKYVGNYHVYALDDQMQFHNLGSIDSLRENPLLKFLI